MSYHFVLYPDAVTVSWFFCPNFFSAQTYFRPKLFFGPNFFFAQTFFLPKLFFCQNFFFAETFFLPKLFFAPNFFSANIFLTHTFFRPKDLLTKTFFQPKNCSPKKMSPKLFFDKILFSAKTNFYQHLFEAKLFFDQIFFSSQSRLAVSTRFILKLSNHWTEHVFNNLANLTQLDSTCPEVGTAQPQLVLVPFILLLIFLPI